MPDTQFLILWFAREDLRRMGISPEKIATLTDNDLQAIADELRKCYFDSGFLEMLEVSIKFALTFKK